MSSGCNERERERPSDLIPIYERERGREMLPSFAQSVSRFFIRFRFSLNATAYVYMYSEASKRTFQDSIWSCALVLRAPGLLRYHVGLAARN